ncbi:MAG: hypothetical protein O3C40_12400 [Planctomycetota bacterium]|nr:hypothetical protein [Planctomycetota bacterium]
MKELSAIDLEIVGFNGAPLVECGRALPIARRKSDGTHAVLDLSDGVARLNWHSEGEAAALLANGRWTKLEKSVFVPQSCCEGAGQFVNQPMVIYADESMLDTADRLPRPPMPSGEYMIWRRLQSHPETVQAACGSAETVEKLLDDWGAALLKRFDAMYRIGRDDEYLKRIADFALCAARNKDLRWRAYSYFATVRESVRMRDTFATFIQREFPAANLEDFMNMAADLKAWLGHVAPLASQPGPPSSEPSSALPKVRGMARARRDSEDELFAK